MKSTNLLEYFIDLSAVDGIISGNFLYSLFEKKGKQINRVSTSMEISQFSDEFEYVSDFHKFNCSYEVTLRLIEVCLSWTK